MNNSKYSQSLEDYLEAICQFGEKNVKSIDLARKLNVSRASVNKAVNSLIEKGLVEKKPYGDISLTHQGIEISRNILWKHNLIYQFLVEILGINHEVALKEACNIEHSISDETAKRIKSLTEKLKQEE